MEKTMTKNPLVRTALAAALVLSVLAACDGAKTAKDAASGQPAPAAAPDSAPLLAATPPMGFNTWNKFGCDVDETLIRETADALAETGMRDAGYRYLVIDDCWQVDRGADGRIVADPKRFAGGMKALADYVHSKGLHFGLYTDIGPKTCAGRPASAGFFDIDAATYAEWGVDYIKVDWCNCDDLDAPSEYARCARPAGPSSSASANGAATTHGRGPRASASSGGRRPTSATTGTASSPSSAPIPGTRRRPAPAAGTTPTCSRSATAA
jgi:hypothetical protein